MENSHSTVVQWPATYPNLHIEFIIGTMTQDSTLSLEELCNHETFD